MSDQQTTDIVAKLRVMAADGRCEGVYGAGLAAIAADEIGRLRGIIRVNGLRAGATHAEIDEVIHGKQS